VGEDISITARHLYDCMWTTGGGFLFQHLCKDGVRLGQGLPGHCQEGPAAAARDAGQKLRRRQLR